MENTVTLTGSLSASGGLITKAPTSLIGEAYYPDGQISGGFFRTTVSDSNIKKFEYELGTEFKMTDRTPHSQRGPYNPMTQTGLAPINGMHKNRFEIDRHRLTWIISIPGVELYLVSVAVVEDELVVTLPRMKDSIPVEEEFYEMAIILGENETVDCVSYNLGELEINVNRNLRIKHLDIEEI